MSARPRAVRLLAFVLATALGWSAWATCAEAASLTATEQMACCKNGHHTCGHHGTPAECCQTAPQAGLSTAAVHNAPPQSPLVLAALLPTAPAAPAVSWQPGPLTDAWSPPGSKHPTYLVLSTLRL